MPSKKTSRKGRGPHQAQGQAEKPPAGPPPDASLQFFLKTLAEAEPRISRPQTKADIRLAAQVWRDYPMGASIISIAEHAIQNEGGGQRRLSGSAIVAKSRLDTLQKRAVELLARVAKGAGIDPTPLFRSAEIARRIYGSDRGDYFMLDPAEVSGNWPECLGQDIFRLERHKRATVRKSGPLLQRLLLKVAQDDGTILSKLVSPSEKPTEDIAEQDNEATLPRIR